MLVRKVSEVPMESTLHEMVVHAAARHADRNAVCFHSYEQPPVFYTYRKMMQLAQELTVFLKSHCSDRKKCQIGLYCHPGINLPSWILGILQIPAAYCPIDPGAPSHLNSYLMGRCSLKFVLVEKDKVEKFQGLFPGWTEQDSSAVHHLDLTLFEVERDDNAVVLPTSDDLDELGTLKVRSSRHQDITRAQRCTGSRTCREDLVIRKEHCLAYVLHTSGTTGVPKIVSVPHQCIVPNIHHLRSIFSITPDDLVFLASPLTFDPSVIELFLALSSGASLLVVPNTIKMMPHRLCDLLFHQHRVTVLQVTPTFLRRFGSCSIRSSVLSRETSLRVLALGGEPFPAVSTVRSWRETGNKTHIFNLYGITEVSSWATYYEISENLLSSRIGNEPPVPLGIPLHGTTVEVQDEGGCKIEEGEGQVLLGGKDRMCFLDEEVTLPGGTMRETGDWVTVKDGDLFFLGRKDNQIKRHGKRLNIEYVQQVVEGLSQVETCAVSWFEAKQLILFVVPNGSVAKRVLWKELQTHLLSHAVPDDMVLIEALPFTTHGKTDVSKLNRIYCHYLRKKKTGCLIRGEDLWDGLQHIWKSVLGLPDDSPSAPRDSVFLLSGGDSLMAIRFHEEVEILVGKPVRGLVEVILSDTILDIHRHISKAVFPSEERKTDDTRQTITGNLSHINRVESNGKYPGKRKYQTQEGSEKEVNIFLSLSKGNRLFVNVPLSSELVSQLLQMRHRPNLQLADLSEIDSPSCECQRTKKTHNIPCTLTSSSMNWTCDPAITVESLPRAQGLSLRVRWKSDTGKCVDASPILVGSTSKDSPVTVYIGSHSHRMQALELHSGKVMWERVLGDRIESSACMSKCGHFLLVGCYDGSLYALNTRNGETHWIFTTGNAVKSSPAIDPLTGLVFVGSHDQHLYALDIEVKQCVWKCHCGGGAVFSSPCISTKPYHLYVATLAGLLMALNPATGSSIWKYAFGKPVFSSPQCNQDHVFVGCVDENFYCFSHAGEKIWKLNTTGPIFSSPCISSVTKQISFGSHDGFIYCCNTDGVLLWKYKTSLRVYATPFVFPNPHAEDTELLAAASTDGNVWILDAKTGLLNNKYKLEGEIFSSPVVWGNSLVVGCRNDYVYCLDLFSNKADR
ncbi:beta-alanine-activating enzyme isoform X2 [Ascaphus truei]|uniref:beta-alanine-activating enzyme isoform X2 n=1 Tax=Ascaphus truei TaxID=8439 RepID=UPI003F593EE6